jgi:hypothetical protein
MNIAKRIIAVAALGAWVASSAAIAGAGSEAASAAYAGQQTRDIKALSERDIAGLLEGQGAGMAKAAELNGYPGPAHTLDLKDPLGLDAGQVAASEALMSAHKARARVLGATLVEAERRLDALFARQQANAEAVDGATREIGIVQAQLRAEHLATHLAQAKLLTADQIKRYSALRGYAGGGAAEPVPGHAVPAPAHRQHH